ncbi:MAG: asparaginase [Anaerolineales bacterium]|nr:asparaginase [Anaerolineales bacterium]
MNTIDYKPLYEIIRGSLRESLHFGAAAVVDAEGHLVASLGNAQLVTFLRSSSKPIQLIPFIESDGDTYFGFTEQEVAILAASHSGTPDHVRILQSIQSKINISEDQLLCGTHFPMHVPSADQIKVKGQNSSANHHNCSGKHSGMLALAQLNHWTTENYISPDHPVQQTIIQTFSEMTSVLIEDIILGTDGCSVPVFAIPLYNAALAYARLACPDSLDKPREKACEKITHAMTAYPEMVAGPDRFDTDLMNCLGTKLFCKSGAEAFFAMGIKKGALSQGSPALGITIKVSDGDSNNRAIPGIALEILNQLGLLDASAAENLSRYWPRTQLTNSRGLVVGFGQPNFTLERTL